MSYLFKTLLVSNVVAVLVNGSCAAPSEPSSLASSGTTPKSQTSTDTGAEGGGGAASGEKAAVDFGGAAVGDVQMQATVKACISTGKFYDRKGSPTPGCTALNLAQVSCKAENIGQFMTAKQKTDLDTLLQGLPEYVLDQCLDCTVPSSSPFCEGTGDTKKTVPGMRLYYVKQSGTQILIQHVYVTK